MYGTKQPTNERRKTVSKKKNQDLERVAGAATSSRPSSRPSSRVGSRANSDNEDSDFDSVAGDDGDDMDDHQHHAELTWEAQLKDAIEDLNEKRSRYIFFSLFVSPFSGLVDDVDCPRMSFSFEMYRTDTIFSCFVFLSPPPSCSS